MANLLQRGVTFLAGMLKEHLSETVVYRRKVHHVAVAAAVGRSQFESLEESGVRVEQTDADFLVAAADLVLAGQRVLPERGDQIERTVEGQVQVYEVNAPGAERPWRYSDPAQTILRIHTKRVKS